MTQTKTMTNHNGGNGKWEKVKCYLGYYLPQRCWYDCSHVNYRFLMVLLGFAIALLCLHGLARVSHFHLHRTTTPNTEAFPLPTIPPTRMTTTNMVSPQSVMVQANTDENERSEKKVKVTNLLQNQDEFQAILKIEEDALRIAEKMSMSDLSVDISLSAIVDALQEVKIVWDFGGVGCSGWAIEATNFAYGLALFLPIGNFATIQSPYRCSGLPRHVDAAMESLPSVNSFKTIDIMITHKPPDRYPSFPFHAWNSHVSKRPRYIVGRSMTEVHRVSEFWAQQANLKVDELWLTARTQIPPFMLGGINPKRLQVIPEAINEELFGELPRPFQMRQKKGFNFLSVFKIEPRKGFDILLRSFISEFACGNNTDVALFLHTYIYSDIGNPRDPATIQSILKSVVSTTDWERRGINETCLESGLSRIHVISMELETAAMPRLYAAMDAMILPTHGEGWGLPLMEAMASGLPTIATNWSGHLEYMNTQNSILIPISGFSPAQGKDFDKGQMWADVDEIDVRKAMRWVEQNRIEAKHIGIRARQDILRNYGIKAVTERILRRLYKIKHLIDESSN